jgi:hypothetical protein
MTINKAQGQTIPDVGVYLPGAYVALYRGISHATTWVLAIKKQKHRSHWKRHKEHYV